MSNLQLFQFNSSEVRIVTRDGEPWFVAKDLCDILEIRNVSDALSRLDEDEKDVIGLTDTIGRKQNMSVVAESGMYALILTSRKSEAKQFRKWITSEIIPQIRKTGSYSIQPEQKRCYYYERYIEFITNNKVPTGYFSIFEETLRLVGQLESKNYVLPKSALPDGSVGKCWANYLKAKEIKLDSVAVKYSHKFPNDPRGTVQAWAYPNEMLPDFREWFETTYKFEKLGNYLKSRQPDALPALAQLLDVPQSVMKQLVG